MITKKCAEELDVVRLLVDLPEQGLGRGEEGTVLLVFNGQPEHYLVEFADREDVALATFVVSSEQIEVVWSFAEHRPKENPAAEQTPEQRAKTYFEQGMIYLQNGVLDQAKEKFCSCFEIDPRYAGTLTNAALPLANAGRWEEAAFIYRLVLSLQPNRQSALDNLALVYLNRGVEQARKKQYDAALASFHEVLGINASEGITQQAQENIWAVHVKRGVELALENRFQEASPHFVMALSLSPAQARRNWIIFLVGWATFREITEPDQLQESIDEMYSRALQAGLEPSEFYNARGAVLANCGRLDEAVAALNKALELDPHNESARQNLARLQEQTQKRYPNEILAEIPFMKTELREGQPLALST